MVPGSPAPLTRIWTCETDLLLLYADDRARLWDVKTLEFWRSMDREKSKELLSQDSWTELFVALRIVCCAHSYFRDQTAPQFAFSRKLPNYDLGLFA